MVQQRLFTDKKFYTPSQKAIIHSFPDANESVNSRMKRISVDTYHRPHTRSMAYDE